MPDASLISHAPGAPGAKPFWSRQGWHRHRLPHELPVARHSVGYLGASDGWQDLHKGNFQMAWQYKEAGPGTVAMMGEVNPGGSDDPEVNDPSPTMQSSPESGARAGYDGCKRKKGRKVHIAVDTLGHLLALVVTPANEQERAQVGELARQVQEATQRSVDLACVDQGYTGKKAAQAAAKENIQLEVVKLAGTQRGFVLLPRRWVVERSFAWLARFRRLSRDDERLPITLAGLHWLALAA